jgi:thiosulfate reductase cytochrome b subunit
LKRIVEKHPLAIRWLHWISFPLLALMVWSGLMIYWANDVYRVGWGGTTLFHFFPDPFYDALNLPQRLAEGMGLHFFFMWFFALNGLVYVAFLAISGEWRFLAPDRHSWRDAILVTLYELHLRKTPPPQSKYNAAQRIAYTGVILMAAGSLITGLAIYKPIQLGWLTSVLGGYTWARAEHFWLMIAFVLFFAVHVIQVMKSGWNNFRSMVAGHELVSAEEQSHD